MKLYEGIGGLWELSECSDQSFYKSKITLKKLYLLKEKRKKLVCEETVKFY